MRQTNTRDLKKWASFMSEYIKDLDKSGKPYVVGDSFFGISPFPAAKKNLFCRVGLHKWYIESKLYLSHKIIVRYGCRRVRCEVTRGEATRR